MFERELQCKSGGPGQTMGYVIIDQFVDTPSRDWQRCRLLCINGEVDAFGGCPLVAGQLCPEFEVSAEIRLPDGFSYPLTEAIMDDLGLEIVPPFKLSGCEDEYPADLAELNGIAGSIVQEILEQGVAQLNILPGVSVDIDLRPKMIARTRRSFSVPLSSGVNVGFAIQGTASTSSYGSGWALGEITGAANTAIGQPASGQAVESVTVPEDFSAFAIEGVSVRFSDGLVLPLQRETDCSDRVDSDGDTLIDYPDDPECTGAFDPTEDS